MGWVSGRLERWLEPMFARILQSAEDRRFREQAKDELVQELALYQAEQKDAAPLRSAARARIRRTIEQGYADNDEVRATAHAVAKKLVGRRKAQGRTAAAIPAEGRTIVQ